MKVSRFAPAHLNRQAICIMEALGMNTLELLAKYKQQIRHVENLELELQTLDTSRHPAKHVYKKAFIPVTTMIKAGLVDQRLLQNVLKCIKCQLLRDLKYKAVKETQLIFSKLVLTGGQRVLVPDGAYLMGELRLLLPDFSCSPSPGIADEHEWAVSSQSKSISDEL
jgi:RNA-dependent RNA polymerase